MLLKWAIRGSVAVLSFGLFGPAEGAEGKITGVAFGDYYFVATGANKNENGCKYRRIYLTYDLEWNDRWSGRVRYEANDSGFGGELRCHAWSPRAIVGPGIARPAKFRLPLLLAHKRNVGGLH